VTCWCFSYFAKLIANSQQSQVTIAKITNLSAKNEAMGSRGQDNFFPLIFELHEQIKLQALE